MRYSASEKFEIIELVEQSSLSILGVRDAAKTFLHFAAHVPGGSGYTIFVRRSVLAGVILCPFKPR